jgi:hypothetical protein
MRKSSWKWFVGFLVIPGGAVVCGILGLIGGAYIGGNYAQDFTFIGGRGYEAAGPLGLIIGAITGGLLSLRLVLIISK